MHNKNSVARMLLVLTALAGLACTMNVQASDTGHIDSNAQVQTTANEDNGTKIVETWEISDPKSTTPNLPQTYTNYAKYGEPLTILKPFKVSGYSVDLQASTISSNLGSKVTYEQMMTAIGVTDGNVDEFQNTFNKVNNGATRQETEDDLNTVLVPNPEKVEVKW